MRDVLSQITKLLALAESPAEEEARSAAMQAVRLIKKHKIELRMPGGAAAASANPFNVPFDSPFDGPIPPNGSVSEFLWRWMRDNQPATPRPQPQPKRPPATPKYHYEQPYTPPPAPSDPNPSPPPPKKKPPAVDPIRVVARFNGKCPHCKLMFHAGDEILWMKRSGATHAKCEAYWEEKE